MTEIPASGGSDYPKRFEEERRKRYHETHNHPLPYRKKESGSRRVPGGQRNSARARFTDGAPSRSSRIAGKTNPERQLEIARNSERFLRDPGRSTERPSGLFYVAVKYRLDGSRMLLGREPWPTGIQNRVSLYTYAQFLGMAAMDNTGRDPRHGGTIDREIGYLLLPEAMDFTDFYAFEDIIRDEFPFTRQETRLLNRIAERDGIAPRNEEQFAASPYGMRVMVDSLLLDEQFMGLAEIGRQLKDNP